MLDGRQRWLGPIGSHESVDPEPATITTTSVIVLLKKVKRERAFDRAQALPRVTRIKIRVGERPKPSLQQQSEQGIISFSREKKQQREKHSAPTHIVAVKTGRVSGWETSATVFTSRFTVTVGASETGFHSKSPQSSSFF